MAPSFKSCCFVGFATGRMIWGTETPPWHNESGVTSHPACLEHCDMRLPNRGPRSRGGLLIFLHVFTHFVLHTPSLISLFFFFLPLFLLYSFWFVFLLPNFCLSFPSYLPYISFLRSLFFSLTSPFCLSVIFSRSRDIVLPSPYKSLYCLNIFTVPFPLLLFFQFRSLQARMTPVLVLFESPRPVSVARPGKWDGRPISRPFPPATSCTGTQQEA
jgi:hypothetical protein